MPKFLSFLSAHHSPENLMLQKGDASAAAATQRMTAPDPSSLVENTINNIVQDNNLSADGREALVRTLAWYAHVQDSTSSPLRQLMSRSSHTPSELDATAQRAAVALLRPAAHEEDAPFYVLHHVFGDALHRAFGSVPNQTNAAGRKVPHYKFEHIIKACEKMLAMHLEPAIYSRQLADRVNWIAPNERSPLSQWPKQARETAIRSADLRDAKLQMRDFSGLNLSHVNFHNADLSNCKLDGAGLQYTRLSGAIMPEASLIGADLARATLQGTDLRGANLTDANLSGADLQGCDARGADFHLATLPSPLHIQGAMFDGANFNGVRVSPLSTQDVASLRLNQDALLNHVENGDSCLLKVNNLPNKVVKIKMMEVLIGGLEEISRQGANLTSNHPSLCDVLLKNSGYLNSPTIRAFFDQHLEPYLHSKAATGGLPWSNGKPLDHPVAIGLCLERTREKLEKTIAISSDNERLIQQAKLGAAVNQLLEAATRHPVCEAQASKLCDRWRSNLPAGLLGKCAEIALEPADKEWYAEISSDAHHALAYDKSYLAQIEGRDDGTGSQSWNHAYLFNRIASGANEWQPAEAVGSHGRSVAEDLRPFPWIANSHRSQEIKNMLPRLMEVVLAGAGQNGKELSDFLKTARATSSLPTIGLSAAAARPWLSPAKQDKLSEIFSPLLERSGTSDRVATATSDVVLKPDHKIALEKALKELLGNVSPSTQARYVLALAATYIKASSSAIMGSEHDSPLLVRAYAAALLNRASEFDPAMIPHNKSTGWMQHLCGSNGAFSCTDLLATDIADTVRQRRGTDKDLAHAFARVYPPAWA